MPHPSQDSNPEKKQRRKPKNKHSISVDQCRKEFLKKLNELSGRFRKQEVFRDFCKVAAIAQYQKPVNSGLIPKTEKYEKLEAEYMSFVPKYGKEGMSNFADMMALTTLALIKEPFDFLGTIYTASLEMGSKTTGQFFTPTALSQLMADIQFKKEVIAATIEKKGFISVLDPAVGGGRLIIAAASRIESLGYNPTTRLFFEAVDVDLDCVNMCYLQTSLLGLTGRVIHGNSLSGKVYNILETPALQVSQYHREILLGNQELNSSFDEEEGNKNQETSSNPKKQGQLSLFDSEEFEKSPEVKTFKKPQNKSDDDSDFEQLNLFS